MKQGNPAIAFILEHGDKHSHDEPSDEEEKYSEEGEPKDEKESDAMGMSAMHDMYEHLQAGKMSEAYECFKQMVKLADVDEPEDGMHEEGDGGEEQY